MFKSSLRIDDRIPAELYLPNDQQKWPVLLLLHGFASNKNEVNNFYVLLAEELAKNNIGSLRIDFTGWGDSLEPMDKSTLDNMLSDALTSYNYLSMHPNISTIGICGFSLGAYIGYHLTERLQKNCSTLVMLSPAWHPEEDLKHSLHYDTLSEMKQNQNTIFSLEWRDDITLGRDFFVSLEKYPSLSTIALPPVKILSIIAKQDFTEIDSKLVHDHIKQHAVNKHVVLDIETNPHIFGMFTNNDQSALVISHIVGWCRMLCGEALNPHRIHSLKFEPENEKSRNNLDIGLN